jgi:dTDP-4-amino-4,6-dideoxygalactose transaminase
MKNQYKIVEDFEKKIAKYAGSKYAVALDSCTNALFLCCKYLNVKEVEIPKKTYVSVPCSIIHAGGSVKFKNINWTSKRYYILNPYPIVDGAQIFRKSMYIKDSYFCISFSMTKKINIGKGGMILTNDKKSVEWFKQARYCGRHEKPLLNDDFNILGWNMYMTPEQAARGLCLISTADEKTEDSLPKYPDLSKYNIFNEKYKN